MVLLIRPLIRAAALLVVIAGAAAGVVAASPYRLFFAHGRELVIDPVIYRVPVAGVSPERLRSSWHGVRSGGRHHEGIDIFAPRGTPVVAATGGIVWRITTNHLGGRVVWLLGPGLVLQYYAHLDDWRDDLAAGDWVGAGDVLGYVGTSGNAKGTPPHLHFGLYPVLTAAPQDPFPMLTRKTLDEGAAGRLPSRS